MPGGGHWDLGIPLPWPHKALCKGGPLYPGRQRLGRCASPSLTTYFVKIQLREFYPLSFVLFLSGSSGGVGWVWNNQSKQEKAVEYKLMLCAYTHIINIIQITRNWQTDVNRRSLPLGVNPTKTQQWLFILGIGLWLSFHVYRLSFHLLCFWIPSLSIVSGIWQPW